MNKLRNRFFSKVDKTESCWVWSSYKTKEGYGRIQAFGKPMYSHRISWLIHFGKIPNGKEVCHRCDNPSCVNPKHLFIGTHKDNMQDMFKKGRRKENQRRGERHWKSNLKEKDILRIRNLYSQGDISMKNIGLLFSIKPNTVFYIVHRKNWSHI